MLQSFTAFSNLYETKVTVRVDLSVKDAEATIVHKGVIRQILDIPFYVVATPELADQWLSRHMDVLREALLYKLSHSRVRVLTNGSLAFSGSYR